MNTFCNNFSISKHDEDENDKLLVRKSTQFPTQVSLFILSGEKFEDEVKLDLPPIFEDDKYGHLYIQILGFTSVNGILCPHQGSGNDTIIVLWNPATGEYKIIPPSLLGYEKIEYYNRPNAFGYDCVKDDYKLIREARYPLDFEGNWVYVPDKNDPFWEADVHKLDMNDHYWVQEELLVAMYDPFWEIYSLKSNSWRKLDAVEMSVFMLGRSQVNLNEFCHWLCPNENMVSFDFSKEKFYTTDLPCDSWISTGTLVVLNEYVSLIICNYDKTKTMYHDIWILGELGVKVS